MARKVGKETETLARHILQTIYIDTDGQPGQWRMLSGIEGVTASVVMYAVNRGWVELRGNHSICLTEVGRRLVLSHAHQSLPNRAWLCAMTSFASQEVLPRQIKACP